MNDIKFYKGESISLVFSAYDKDGKPLDISGYTKEVSLFTPFSTKLVKSVTGVSNSSFSANITAEETSGFEQEGNLNIIVKLKKGTEVKIAKSIPFILLDPDSSGCGDTGRLSVDSGNIKIDMSFDTNFANFDVFFGGGITLIGGEGIEEYLKDYAKTETEDGNKVVYAPNGIIEIPEDVLRAATLFDFGAYLHVEKDNYLSTINGTLVADTAKATERQFVYMYPVNIGIYTLEADFTNAGNDAIKVFFIYNAAGAVIQKLTNTAIVDNKVTFNIAEKGFISFYLYHAHTTGTDYYYSILDSYVFTDPNDVGEIAHAILFPDNKVIDISNVEKSLTAVEYYETIPIDSYRRKTTGYDYLTTDTGSIVINPTLLDREWVYMLPLSAGDYTLQSLHANVGNAVVKRIMTYNSKGVFLKYISFDGITNNADINFSLPQDGFISFYTYINDSTPKYVLSNITLKKHAGNEILFPDGSKQNITDLGRELKGSVLARSNYPTGTYGYAPTSNLYYYANNQIVSGSIGIIEVNCLADSTVEVVAIDKDAKTLEPLGTIYSAAEGPYQLDLKGKYIDKKLIGFKSTKGLQYLTYCGVGMYGITTDLNTFNLLPTAEIFYYIFEYAQETANQRLNALESTVAKSFGNPNINTSLVIGSLNTLTIKVSASGAVKTIPEAINIAMASTQKYVSIVLTSNEEYRLTNMVTVNMPNKSIRFTSDGNAKAIIKGSQLIPAASMTEVSTGVYRFAVAKNEHQFIVVNGKMKLPASTKRVPYDVTTYANDLPKINNVTKVKENGRDVVWITLSATDIAKLTTENYITAYNVWISHKSKIIEVDRTGNRIKVAGVAVHGSSYLNAGSSIVIENINSNLSIDGGQETFRKGTFYTSNGYMYYKLEDNETVGTLKLEVPVVENLFDIKSPCGFNNIQFSGSYYNLYQDYNGTSCQDRQSGYEVPASINCFGSYIGFSNCEFTHFGQHAIRFRNGSNYGTIKNCYFHDTGMSAFYLGETSGITNQAPTNILATNNVIRDTGKILQQSSAVIIGYIKDSVIERNDISRTTYSGITMGFSWRYEMIPTALSNVIIRHNRIHKIGNKVLTDLGGIYLLGDSGKSIVENNIIFDVTTSNNLLGAGIYLDEAAKTTVVRNNIVYDTILGVLLNFNFSNYIYNNIFAYYKGNAFHVNEIKDPSFIYSNIVYSSSSNLGIASKTDNCALDSNIYYARTGAYSANSMDAAPCYLDPLFLDPEHRNFSISDTSNVDFIDFKPIKADAGVIGKMKEFVTD